MKMIYDVEDKPKFGKLLIFALQQVLAIMAATILVPKIIGLPMQIPAALLGAGIGTIVYLLFTKFKSPVFLGSSFAFLGSLGTAVAFGYLGIIVGAIFAGLVYVVIAIVIHFVGTKWVSKLMPPIIIGPTVALIGLTLAGSAMGQMVSADSDVVNGSYNLLGLLCGLITFLTVVICSTQKKYKSMKLIPFIIGIGVGYVSAAFFSIFGYAFDVSYLKVINFDPLIYNFINADGTFVGVTAFLNYPDFALIEAIKELVNGNVSETILAANENAVLLNGTGVAEVAIAFLPVAFVVFAEHIADHKNLSSIIGRDLVEGEPGLERTLLGDGVGSIVGTIFGICPNTTYGESVGCVAITRNASMRTIFAAACMCIVLSFFTPIMSLLQTIPNCVMGGVCLTLYGFIAVSGLKMFKDIDLGENKNLFVVSVILIAGIGGLSIQIPYQIAGDGSVAKVITVTSIATALILGIITYAILNKVEKSKLGEGEDENDGDSLPAAAVCSVVEPNVNASNNDAEAVEAVEDTAEDQPEKPEE